MSDIENLHTISMPSRCIPYDGVKADAVMARSYTGRDEIYLAEITPNNLDLKFLQIMKSTIVGLDPEKMTLGDRQYFILWEYIKSYSNYITLESVCLHCGKPIEVTIDLRELDVIELPDGFTQPYPVKLPSGLDVNLRLLTVRDEIDAVEFEQKSNEGLVFRCARSVVEDGDIVQKMEKLKSLPARDLATIRAFHEEFYHGPNMNTKFKCPKCNEEDDIEVPFRFEFIFPRGKVLTGAFGKRIQP